MANKIKVKLILQLRDAKLSRSDIASSRHMSRHSVSEVFNIADLKGITYDDVRDLDEDTVYRIFYPEKHTEETMYADPDYPHVHVELKKTGVTLKLLHEEYVERCQREGLIPMGRTKFNEGYREYTIAEQLTNHIEHKPGEKAEVDWSGKKMSYLDTQTGEEVPVYLFVGTLPYSQYSYVEACRDMKMDTFLRCHVRMYEYFGGVPIRTVCDNLKTGVISHPKEGEIVLTEDYSALGEHYMTAIMPAGVRKPKQKASVEGTVGKIATAIIAKCRNERFYSLEDVRKGVAEKLREFNHEPFQKRSGSRSEALKEELPYMRPLPALPYEIAEWVYGRIVNLDYHVVYRKNRYSCPYQYAKKKVDLKITDKTVQIYYQDERLTTHNRFPDNWTNRYSTHAEDMPPAFRNITQWDDDRICGWADKIGTCTRTVIDRIFESVSIKEQGYNPSLAVLRLSRKYSDARLESACELALGRGIRSPRYRHLNAILSSNQDVLYLEQKNGRSEQQDNSRGYLRGADYYRKGGAGHVE